MNITDERAQAYGELLSVALDDARGELTPIIVNGKRVLYTTRLANRNGVTVALLAHELSTDEAKEALHKIASCRDVVGADICRPPDGWTLDPLNKINLALLPYRLGVRMTQARFTGGSFWQISLGGYRYAIHACDDCFEALSYWLTLPKDNDTKETMGEMIADDQGAQALTDIQNLIEEGMNDYAK